MGILAAKTTAPASTSNHISTITPAMTAAFTPTATACLNNQLTMLENQAYNIWLNYPLPVPHSTFSDCYPSQFMSSFLASAAGTTQAAFSPLVCPGGYTTVSTSWPAASNYIACCPRFVSSVHSGILLSDRYPALTVWHRMILPPQPGPPIMLNATRTSLPERPFR
jgi:hypothetical protein